MPTTVGRWALRVPVGTDGPPDVPLWLTNLATDLSNVAMDDQGTLAARPVSTIPSPGKVGRYWTVVGDPVAAENGRTYRDTGTGWIEQGGSEWTTIATGAGALSSSAPAPAGLFMLGMSGSPLQSGASGGAPLVIPFRASDFARAGRNLRLRVVGAILSNATDPGSGFVFGLGSVAGGGSGAAMTNTATTIAASLSAAANPVANDELSVYGPEFAPPADGLYVLTVQLPATAASSFSAISARLERRYIG